MNLDLQQYRNQLYRPGVAAILLALLVGIIAFQALVNQPGSNPVDTPVNSTDNQTLNDSVNKSQYYNESKKACEVPEINVSNTSQVRECVENRTTQ